MIKAICLHMKTISTSQTWWSNCYKQKPKASWPGPEEIAGVMQFSAFKKKKEKKKNPCILSTWLRATVLKNSSMPVWRDGTWVLSLLLPSIPRMKEISRHSRDESRLKPTPIGHTTESLEIIECYLWLAQCKKSLDVNSGNPYTTKLIFLTSLDQQLLNKIFFPFVILSKHFYFP